MNEKRKLVGIVSPPFEDQIQSNQMGNYYKRNRMAEYGNSPGQIGLLKSNGVEEEEFDITKFHNCDEDLYWYGCYAPEKDFKRFIHPDTYAHPAKASMLLLDRIFKHLKKLDLLKKGDIVCDFMAGTGRTNIMASLHGFDSIAVELEPHFIKMIEQNKSTLENQLGKKVNWKIIQGDARKLTELIDEKNLIGITSPPYFQQGDEPSRDDKTINIKGRVFARNLYGKTDGQISLLPDKKLVGNQQGETYLSAMLQVYNQASYLMPILVTITKNPTRKGKLRRLDLDTAKLLMMCGYNIVDYHRALLFEEKKQKTILGTIKKDLKGRLSFFKRLSVQKGNVTASWEDIIIAVREDLLNDMVET